MFVVSQNYKLASRPYLLSIDSLVKRKIFFQGGGGG